MRNKRGFSLIELMVVVAIIAILASVALPMYSTFRRKANASVPADIMTKAKGALIAHFQEEGSFTGITRRSDGALAIGSNMIGVGIPNVEDISWGAAVIGSAGARFEITWSFMNNKCDPCEGRYCIVCRPLAGSCAVAVTYVAGEIADKMNHDRDTVGCAAP